MNYGLLFKKLLELQKLVNRRAELAVEIAAGQGLEIRREMNQEMRLLRMDMGRRVGDYDQSDYDRWAEQRRDLDSLRSEFKELGERVSNLESDISFSLNAAAY